MHNWMYLSIWMKIKFVCHFTDALENLEWSGRWCVRIIRERDEGHGRQMDEVAAGLQQCGRPCLLVVRFDGVDDDDESSGHG